MFEFTGSFVLRAGTHLAFPSGKCDGVSGEAIEMSVVRQIRRAQPAAGARAHEPDSPWSDDDLRDALALACRLAQRWVDNRQDAEDIAQEAVCRLFLQRRVESPRAWLAVVVRRLAWRASHERRIELAALAQVRRQSTLRHLATVAVERCELRALLARASPHDRLLLRLDGLGYSDAEIGRAIGCRPNSVHTLLARARARLRRLSVR